jgi:hypothetical protein
MQAFQGRRSRLPGSRRWTGVESDLDRILKTIRPERRNDRARDGTLRRVCVAPDCNTNLSRYNPGDLCGVHAPIYGSRKW